MTRWWRRRGPSRRQLVERKHRLAGEIRGLEAELRQRRARSQSVGELEARIARLRDQHQRTRLQIDRTHPDAPAE